MKNKNLLLFRTLLLSTSRRNTYRYSKDKKKLILFPAGNGLEEFHVPEGTEQIGKYEIGYLHSVTI